MELTHKLKLFYGIIPYLNNQHISNARRKVYSTNNTKYKKYKEDYSSYRMRKKIESTFIVVARLRVVPPLCPQNRPHVWNKIKKKPPSKTRAIFT